MRIQVIMPDHSVWTVPFELMAKCAIREEMLLTGYPEKQIRKSYLDHKSYVVHWAERYVPWNKIKALAKRIKKGDASQKDNAEGWKHGPKCILDD